MRYELSYKDLPPNLGVVAQVFYTRGVAIDDIPHYLNTDDTDILDPLLLKNMDKGARMLVSHIAKNDKVFIQVDSDADGYTSAAALINYLNMLFPHFTQTNISYRLHDQKMHGLIVDTIPEDVKLVIAPDSSSNDYEQHQTLHEKGIDILVLDHHLAEKESEYACVINNNTSDYPNKTLSGVGVVYKFCSYLDQLLHVNYSKDILDLVALGIVSDMMDLKNFETRRLITLGFNNVRNPYFKGMIAKNSYTLADGLTPIGIAFSVAPSINAVTRVGTSDEKVVLFESMLDFRGYEMIPSTKQGCKGQWETRVEQACRICINVKQTRQRNARDASLEIIKKIIKDENLLDNKILMIKLPSAIAAERNLTGLIATQLANDYQRPSLVLNETVHETLDENNNVIGKNEMWEGSGRGYDNCPIDSCRDFFLNTGLVEYVEGHDNAFGFGILKENADKFLAQCNEELKDFDFTPKYSVDFIWDGNNIDSYAILDLGKLKEFWGQGLAEPLIAIENISVNKDNVCLSKGICPTLRIWAHDFNGNEITLIKFRSSNEEYEALYSELGCVKINIIGVPKINTYYGVEKPQIEIKDMEIIRRTAYYF